MIAHGSRVDDQSRNGNIVVQATVELEDGDDVYVRLEGHLFDLGEPTTTYFEGRLVSKVNIDVNFWSIVLNKFHFDLQ